MKSILASALFLLFAVPAFAQQATPNDIYDPAFVAQVKAVAPQAIKTQVRTVPGVGKNVVRTETVEYVDLTALTFAMMQQQQTQPAINNSTGPFGAKQD